MSWPFIREQLGSCLIRKDNYTEKNLLNSHQIGVKLQ